MTVSPYSLSVGTVIRGSVPSCAEEPEHFCLRACPSLVWPYTVKSGRQGSPESNGRHTASDLCEGWLRQSHVHDWEQSWAGRSTEDMSTHNHSIPLQDLQQDVKNFTNWSPSFKGNLFFRALVLLVFKKKVSELFSCKKCKYPPQGKTLPLKTSLLGSYHQRHSVLPN